MAEQVGHLLRRVAELAAHGGERTAQPLRRYRRHPGQLAEQPDLLAGPVLRRLRVAACANKGAWGSHRRRKSGQMRGQAVRDPELATTGWRLAEAQLALSTPGDRREPRAARSPRAPGDSIWCWRDAVRPAPVPQGARGSRVTAPGSACARSTTAVARSPPASSTSREIPDGDARNVPRGLRPAAAVWLLLVTTRTRPRS